MIWSIHRWTWQLDSPLFVGTTPAGALNRCRLYVPARAMWGALTAELARCTDPAENWTLDQYKNVAEKVRKDYRLSYLYPAQEVCGKWRAWLPCYERGQGLAWRREDDHSELIADREFRRRLLHTRAGTAINPGSDTAADGSLRETECLQPRWRDAAGRDRGEVALVGYVFSRISDGDGTHGIERLMPVRSIFIGGDIRYGLGRLERVAVEPVQRENPFFGLEVDLRKKDLVVQSSVVLAHTYRTRHMSGALEVLNRWDVGKLSAADVMPLWVPGSRNAGAGVLRFRIDPEGTWSFEDGAESEASTAGITSA